MKSDTNVFHRNIASFQNHTLSKSFTKHLTIIIISLFICLFSFGQTDSIKPCKFDYAKNYVPTCPHNHTDNIISIVYGKPTAQTIKRAEKGEVHLGGCIIVPCHPKFYCKVHKEKF